jgi:hypothetical protein
MAYRSRTEVRGGPGLSDQLAVHANAISEPQKIFRRIDDPQGAVGPASGT